MIAFSFRWWNSLHGELAIQGWPVLNTATVQGVFFQIKILNTRKVCAKVN